MSEDIKQECQCCHGTGWPEGFQGPSCVICDGSGESVGVAAWAKQLEDLRRRRDPVACAIEVIWRAIECFNTKAIVDRRVHDTLRADLARLTTEVDQLKATVIEQGQHIDHAYKLINSQRSRINQLECD